MPAPNSTKRSGARGSSRTAVTAGEAGIRCAAIEATQIDDGAGLRCPFETFEEGCRPNEVDLEDPLSVVHHRGHSGEVKQSVEAPERPRLTHERVDRRPGTEVCHRQRRLGDEAPNSLERLVVDVNEEEPALAEPLHAARGPCRHRRP